MSNRLSRQFMYATYALSAVSASPIHAQVAAPTAYRTLPIQMAVRERPTAVRLTDGRYHVAYALFITNWMDHDLMLLSVGIAAAGAVTKPGVRAREIATVDSAALTDPFRYRLTYYVESAKRSAANRALPKGRSAVVSLDYIVASPADLPTAIEHRLRFAFDSTLAMRLDNGATTPDLASTSEAVATSRTPIVIGAPLRGGPWQCANGLTYSNAHSSVYPYRNAVMRVPQRFGCDFFKVDSAGDRLPSPFPDTISNSMFYGYGAPVIAVADGVIDHVTDGVPENVPQVDGSTKMPVPLTNETVSGNWVSLRVGAKVYAFYAHLQPGSITVREGQRVKRGQVIGRLGNAGNAVGPHLHFHLGNANSLNGSDAVAYVFDAFDYLGQGKLGGPGKPGSAASPRRRELPGDGVVIRFR